MPSKKGLLITLTSFTTSLHLAGPADGDSFEMKIAIASTNALKADSIGVRGIGFGPGVIGYLYYLNKEGLGDYSLDNLEVDVLSGIKRTLNRHGTFDVQRRRQ